MVAWVYTGSEVEEPGPSRCPEARRAGKTRWYVRGHSSQPGAVPQARDEMSYSWVQDCY